MSRRTLTQRPRDDRGQALVEMAIVAPLLCALLIGICQFGLCFFNYIDLTSAARDGGRKLTVSRTATDPAAAVKQAIANSTSVVDDSKTTVTITPSSGWKSGDDVTVKVTYPYTLDVLGVAVWSGPMTTSSVVRVE